MAYKDPYQEIPVKDFSYVNNEKAVLPKAKRKWGLIVTGLIVLVILGAGAFAYGHYTKIHKAKPAKSTTSKSLATTTPEVPLTSYTSINFNLSVSYPKTWAVVDSSGTTMTITSPPTTLTSDTGKSVDGLEVITVLNQGQAPAVFGSSSVAVLNSQDISFTNPTSAQAAQAYISFVQYPATTALGGLDAIYVTGNNGYDKGQNIPVTDVNQVDPLIFVSFEKCNNASCSSISNLAIDSSMWSSSAFSTPILDTLKSFSLS